MQVKTIMGLFGDLFDVASNVAKVAVTPVEVVASLAKDIAQPVAETVKELAEDIKSITK